MYDLSSVCFMCLCNNSSIKNISQKDIENETVNQVKYVLPELMILKPEVTVNMCTTCHTKLHTFFIFKKMCLENYCRLKCYIKSLKTLQKPTNADNQEINYIIDSNGLNKNEALTEQNTNIGVTIKEDMDTDVTIIEENNDPLMTAEEEDKQKNSTITIDIKEECISSSDSDTDCFRPFQFVKCEVSEEPLNSGPSNETQTHSNYDYVNSLYNKNFLKKSDWTKYTSIHIGGKDFRCLICNKEFTAKHTLKTHMKLHEGIKEFECIVCHKKFSRNSHLKEHNKLHEGIKDYECTVCNKKFTQNSHLKIHLKMHEGIKNFECNVCQKKFTLKCTLTRHMKFHAGIKDFECKVCFKKFSQNGHLKAHILNVHAPDKLIVVT